MSGVIDNSRPGRLVAEYETNGRVELRTSIVPIVLWGAVALASGAATVLTAAGAFRDGSARGVGVVVVAFFGCTFFGWYVLRLLVPRIRVVVDRDGLLVLGRRLRWDQVSGFDSTVVGTGRSSYRVVVARVTREDAAPWHTGSLAQRMIRATKDVAPDQVALPYFLQPAARHLAPALEAIRAMAGPHRTF